MDLLRAVGHLQQRHHNAVQDTGFIQQLPWCVGTRQHNYRSCRAGCFQHPWNVPQRRYATLACFARAASREPMRLHVSPATASAACQCRSVLPSATRPLLLLACFLQKSRDAHPSNMALWRRLSIRPSAVQTLGVMAIGCRRMTNQPLHQQTITFAGSPPPTYTQTSQPTVSPAEFNSNTHTHQPTNKYKLSTYNSREKYDMCMN